MFPVFLHPELPSGTLRPTTAVAIDLIPIEMEWQATLFSFTGVTDTSTGTRSRTPSSAFQTLPMQRPLQPSLDSSPLSLTISPIVHKKALTGQDTVVATPRPHCPGSLCGPELEFLGCPPPHSEWDRPRSSPLPSALMVRPMRVLPGGGSEPREAGLAAPGNGSAAELG